MPVVLPTAALLILSNVFMTFAWYAHLKNLSERPWYVAAIASWGIALFEYLLQVPPAPRFPVGGPVPVRGGVFRVQGIVKAPIDG
jgi:uncharacterized protein (DUF486 family)